MIFPAVDRSFLLHGHHYFLCQYFLRDCTFLCQITNPFYQTLTPSYQNTRTHSHRTGIHGFEFSHIAHLSGAPDLFGGFVAGIALSRRFFLPMDTFIKADPEFSISVHTQMKPIIQLFTPIFFVMVSLSLDLRAVEWGSLFIWVFSFTTLIIAIAGTMMGAFLINENNNTRLAIGMSMVPRGEVGLIFTEIGRSSGILDDTIYAGIILVIAYTTITSPIWI